MTQPTSQPDPQTAAETPVEDDVAVAVCMAAGLPYSIVVTPHEGARIQIDVPAAVYQRPDGSYVVYRLPSADSQN